MIKKYQEVFKLSDYEELVKSIKRLNTKREGVRYDKIKVSETISAKDVKRMLCTGGRDPIDESEIDQFLTDIGFEADKFVNINDFAQFLLE